MKTRSVAPMRIAKVGYLVMSVVYCVVGVLVIALPSLTSATIGIIMGVTMVVFGGVKLVGYFSKDLYRLAFQYDLEFGILLTIFGAIALAKPEESANFLFVALGVAAIVDSLFKCRISLESQIFGIKYWWTMLIFAMLTGTAGIVLIFCPTGAALTKILFGIVLLTEGILNMCVVLCTVKIVKNQKPDVIDVDYTITDGENL